MSRGGWSRTSPPRARHRVRRRGRRIGLKSGHRNAPKVQPREELPGSPDPTVGRPLQPLQDDEVYHHGQPIAVVVADTLERATQAATLVRFYLRY